MSIIGRVEARLQDWRRMADIWRPRRAVGVVVGASTVTAARLARTASGWDLATATSSSWPGDRDPHPAEIESAVAEAVTPFLTERTKVVLGLETQAAELYLFTPPFPQPARVGRVLKYESEPFFLNPVEELALDYYPWSNQDGSLAGAVFGARSTLVASRLETLRPLGLDPATVLPQTLGLVLAGRELFQARPPEQRLLLNLEAGQTDLLLFNGAVPRLVRSIPHGHRDLTTALAQARTLAWFEAEEVRSRTDPNRDLPESQVLAKAWKPIIMEIRRTIAASRAAVGLDPDSTPPKLVLAGSGAQVPGLAAFLSHRLGLEATMAPSLKSLAGAALGPPPEALAAWGLALAALAPGHRPNLRQGDLAPRRIPARYRRPLAVMAAGLALALTANLAELIIGYQAQARRYREVKSDIERLYRDTVPGATKVVEPLSQMRQELDKLQAGAAGLDPAGGRTLDMLWDLTRLAGQHAGLRITDLALGPQNLEISGEGPSYEVIDQFKNELAGLPYLTQVTIGGARLDPGTKILGFRLSMKRRAT